MEENGVRIIIEPTAIMHVLGTTMDFVEDRIRYRALYKFGSTLIACRYVLP